jgi:hypothetical protein
MWTEAQRPVGEGGVAGWLLVSSPTTLLLGPLRRARGGGVMNATVADLRWAVVSPLGADIHPEAGGDGSRR